MRADRGLPAWVNTLCLPPSLWSSSWEASTCMLPIPLTLPLLPSQGKELLLSAAPRRCPSWGTSHPTTTHAAGDDFLACPLVHREGITVLRAHRQCQCEPACSCSGGLDPCWIRPPATQGDRVPLEGQLCPWASPSSTGF